MSDAITTGLKAAPAVPADPGVSPVAVSLDQEVLRERLELHAHMLQRMPLAHIALVGGLALTEAPRLALTAFLGWAAWVLCFETLRAVYATWVRKHLARLSLPMVEWQMVVLAGLSGASVGMTSVLFGTKLPVEGQVLLALVLFATSAASVATAQASRLINGALSGAMLTVAAAGWVPTYPQHALPMVVLAALYVWLLTAVAGESERMLRRSIAVRRERDQMVRKLEHGNALTLQAVQRAEDAAAVRSRVLAAASHDLRQPVHALSLYSAILNARPTPETLDEVSTKIDQIVHSLGALLDGLLDLSQLSSGHYVPTTRTFQLDAVLSAICAEYRSVAQAKGLHFDVDTVPLTVHSDPLALARILRNLVDNALKYTPQGGVTVALRREADEAVIRVSDTGQGIAAVEHERIFEEFYQLANPGRDRMRGVGLGLAIVQRLVNLIGARIALRSNEGEGTTFEVRIPGADQLPHTETVVVPRPQGATSLEACVYLVDDEIDILNSASALLEAWGFQVRTATGMQETQTLFELHGVPDLLIVDLRLREQEHGLALASRMRETYGAFPVLVVTGETSSAALLAAKLSGYGLLHKPVAADVLRERIDDALAGRSRPPALEADLVPPKHLLTETVAGDGRVI